MKTKVAVILVPCRYDDYKYVPQSLIGIEASHEQETAVRDAVKEAWIQ